MPELPEVETIVRELDKIITGKKINRFFVYDTKRIKKPKISLPQKVKSVKRHGKYIVCEMHGDLRCIVHLRMTGELLFEEQVANGNLQMAKRAHERVRFYFNDSSTLRFIDVRRFGTVEWVGRAKPLPSLGVDPLSPQFTSKKLKDLLGNSSRPVKSALLDQQKIAGIGNIYADEALWHAKIRPTRKAGSLGAPEASRLVLAIRRVLNEGIKKGGFTLRDYRHVDGSSGYYQKSRKVYDREGEKCLRCGAKIRRIKVGGRSSYFCFRCQK